MIDEKQFEELEAWVKDTVRKLADLRDIEVPPDMSILDICRNIEDLSYRAGYATGYESGRWEGYAIGRKEREKEILDFIEGGEK